MRAKVSVCLIVKNDESCLEDCLLSFRDYVDEIVVVDTGSTDKTIEIAKKYADKVEVFTECNNPETGAIEDFSMARNRSLELASNKWAMWIDSDDVLQGADKLYKLIEETEKSDSFKEKDAVCIMFPYEYSYNERGQCIMRHIRERLFSNKNLFKFVNAVHECAIHNEGTNVIHSINEEIVFKHRRQYINKASEPGRNLRILRKFYEKHGDSDARHLYYLALECKNAGLIDEAIKHFSKYVEISGWEDERVMACLELAHIYLSFKQFNNGLEWAFKAIALKETWGEGYFAVAKMFYFMALEGGPDERRHWERCAYFARVGLNLPPTQTLLFINPLEREYEIHKYLNFALNKLDNVIGALESVNMGLKSNPDDPTLLLNKSIYEKHILLNQVNLALNQLNVDNNKINLINNILNNNLNDEWKIPSVFDINQNPIDINDNELSSVILLLWQQLMLRNKIQDGLKLLESSPVINNNITEATQKTRDFIDELFNNSKGLDIVFYTGHAVEKWSPSTIKKNGIGGSEIMAYQLAKNLAALGHKVRVYNDCAELAGYYDNVQYINYDKFNNIKCDVLIISRQADKINNLIDAKLKLLWVHDIFAINATNETLLKYDRILCLSEWHKQSVLDYHHLHSDHVIVTRNGIDLARFAKNIKKDKFKCFNSSSPDRSWPILLEIWPEIKAKVPEASLHLFYGFKNWKYAAQKDQLQQDLIKRIEEKIKSMKNLDVYYYDRVNQDDLADHIMSCGVWLYPTWFTETSCLSCMEAQAGGCRMITSSIAALNETGGERAVLIDGDWTTKEYQDKFIEETVKALTEDSNQDREQIVQYANKNFGIIDLAKDWEKMFFNLIEIIKENPIVPYRPTGSYELQ